VALDIVGGFVFVADFAEDFFDEVFEGGDAGGIAVFVDDIDHVDAAGLHFAEEVGGGFGFGDAREGAEEAREGGAFALVVAEFPEVADMDEADDAVDGAIVDGDAGELFGADEGAEVFEGPVGGDGDDGGSGVMTSRTRLSPKATTD
jgi:hypothetical protein